MQKLIVMDMDGTLLTNKKELLPKTRDALLAQQAKGHTLVLASGRVKSRMIEFAKELQMDVYGGYFIEANGSVLYDIKKEERQILRSMSYEEADEIFTYLRKTFPTYEIMIMGDVNAFVNLPQGQKESTFFNTNNMESLRNRNIYYIQNVYEIDEIFYKVCIYKDPESIVSIMKDIQHHFKDMYWCGRTMPFWLEIMPIQTNKGNALSYLMEKLKFDKDSTYIFGDGENDISMLKVGHSIAMGNALKSVKEVCEYTTLSNEEDGIAAFINTYLEEKE